MTISPLPNADWRANAKHKKELYIPARAQPQQQSTAGTQVLSQNPSSFGLQIQTKSTIETTEIIENGSQETVERESVTFIEKEQPQQEAPKTLEERAIEAIIKGMSPSFTTKHNYNTEKKEFYRIFRPRR